jgi:hypothetical protein
VVVAVKMGQGGGRVSLRGRKPLGATISSGRWRGRTPLRDGASWMVMGPSSTSLGAGTMKAWRYDLAAGGFGQGGRSPPEMARGGDAELGKAIPTSWRANSTCPWSIFGTGAASPDGDGADL